jgi:hypothetical protein
LKTYENKARLLHKDLVVENAGLQIHCEHTFLGASPDSHVKCTCCGEGVVEVKCPHCAKDSTLEKIADESKQFCLQKDQSGNLHLADDHAYYQIQLQMAATKTNYCDFVVWTPDSSNVHIERVKFDPEFFAESVVKAAHFYKVGVLPELLGKWYSTERKPEEVISGNLSCFCLAPAQDKNLIVECQSSFCKLKKFHLQCLGLKRKPKKNYLCPNCRPVEATRKKAEAAKKKTARVELKF